MEGDKKKGGGSPGRSLSPERSGSSERSESPDCVGKHKILVETKDDRFRSNCYVVDLRLKKREMENPHKLFTDMFMGTEAVVREEDDIILVYQFGGMWIDPSKITNLAQDERVHPFLGTSKSVLNLKTNPPTWSVWEDCEAKTHVYTPHPLSATLGNKLFAFKFIASESSIGQVYDTANNNAKWEDITTPFSALYVSHPVLSDSKNNRLILHFEGKGMSCLYAYNPDKETKKWDCLDPTMESLPGSTAQVVDDVIYFFDSPFTIHAYDIPQRKWLNVSWPGKNLQHYRPFFPPNATMMHLGGGKMCLAASCVHPPPDLLQFLTFHVSRVDEEAVQLIHLIFHAVEAHLGPGPGLNTFIPF